MNWTHDYVCLTTPRRGQRSQDVGKPLTYNSHEVRLLSSPQTRSRILISHSFLITMSGLNIPVIAGWRALSYCWATMQRLQNRFSAPGFCALSLRVLGGRHWRFRFSVKCQILLQRPDLVFAISDTSPRHLSSTLRLLWNYSYLSTAVQIYEPITNSSLTEVRFPSLYSWEVWYSDCRGTDRNQLLKLYPRSPVSIAVL